MHTSLADYSQFMFAHLDGENGSGSIVAPETFQFLHAPPPGSPYAIGWYVLNDPYRGGRSLVHAGSNTFWWAQVRLIPDSDLAVMVAANAANANAQKAVGELEVTLVERALAAP
jgi:hypothetical protein